MNKFALSLLLIAGLALLSASPAPSPSKAALKTSFYWYTYPGDSYNDFNSISGEANQWMQTLLVLVDQNPIGGTTIAWGFTNNAYPHTVLPSQFLYAHYTDDDLKLKHK